MDHAVAEYVIFLAKTVTVVAAVGLLAAFVLSGARKGRGLERIEVKSLNRQLETVRRGLRKEVLPRREFLRAAREERRRRKEERKRKGERRRRVFVIDFQGDIRATAVSSLREEITAILTCATPEDEVLVRLENAGGFIHDHGLAASQLSRIRNRGIPLVVAVDKVAASGGYLMACVADRILTAPFAVVGSIGVLAQLPNFHELLLRHGIQFEQIKAGELKRTLTMFGQNTEEDRARMRGQLEEKHALFKSFVGKFRPRLDLARVSTGEHWHGTQAVDLALADEVKTSDDYLMEASRSADVFHVTYARRRGLRQRALAAVRAALDPQV